MLEDISKAVLSRRSRKITCHYHVRALDDFLYGIMPDDLVLIGAETGAGKTEMAIDIAFKNSVEKRVHLFALEVDDYEPLHRMIYKGVAKRFFSDKDRDRSVHLSWRAYMANAIDVSKYEDEAAREVADTYKNITIHYKDRDFPIEKLTQKIGEIKHDCDLIVLDHVDYLDIDDYKSENLAMGEIMKIIREENKITHIPMVIVSHLRKKTNIRQVIPTTADFMGSSHKTKQVKTVILISSDNTVENHATGIFGTYIYVAKSRWGSMRNMVAKASFDSTENRYLDKYTMCWINNFGEGTKEMKPGEIPWWSTHQKAEAEQEQIKTLFGDQ